MARVRIDYDTIKYAHVIARDLKRLHFRRHSTTACWRHEMSPLRRIEPIEISTAEHRRIRDAGHVGSEIAIIIPPSRHIVIVN